MVRTGNRQLVIGALSLPGSFGCGLNWWWKDTHDNGGVENYRGLAEFMRGVDFEWNDFRPFKKSSIFALTPQGFLAEDLLARTEVFYLKNQENTQAMGWVHNRKAYWAYAENLHPTIPAFGNECYYLVDSDNDPTNNNSVPMFCPDDDLDCQAPFQLTSLAPRALVLTPNGDNCNDVWYLADKDNWCAFNAMRYHLRIFDRWNIEVYELIEEHNYCCPFYAPSGNQPECPTNVPQDFSSIYWDGRCNQLIGSGDYPESYNGNFTYALGEIVPEGIYFYTLRLRSGCGHIEDHEGYMCVILDPNGTNACGEPPQFASAGTVQNNTIVSGEMYNGSDIVLTPSFNGDGITVGVSGKWARSVQSVQVYAMDGRLLALYEHCGGQCALQVSGVSAGIYFVKVLSEHGLHTYKFMIP